MAICQRTARILVVGCFILMVGPRAVLAQQSSDAPTGSVSDRAAVRLEPAPRRVPAPNVQWSGFYLGGSVGYGGGDADTTFIPRLSGPFNLNPDTLSPDPMGWTYGFHGGVNFRWTTFVTGVEADFNKASIAGDAVLSPFVASSVTVNGAMVTDQSLNWFSTFRGRFGVAAHGMLYFGTAGLAIGGLDHDSNIFDNTIQFPASESGTQLGWTIGGGVEGAINGHLTWRAQYLYLNLGETTGTGNPLPSTPGASFDYNWISRTNVFNGGMSWKF